MDDFKPIQDLIDPYLKGLSINQLAIKLNTIAQLNERHALSFFQTSLEQEELQRLFLQLPTSSNEISLKDYHRWRKSLMLEDHCIHVLEYLAYRRFHRFNYLIKQIYQTKAPPKLHRYYLSAMIGLILAGIYFTLNQNAWLIFLDFISINLPKLFTLAIEQLLIPQNLALLMLSYLIFNYLSLAFNILADNASTTTRKMNQLCHLSLYSILTAAAQSIIFLNLPATYISGFLFIFANFIQLTWRLVECYLLKKDQPLMEVNPSDHYEYIRLEEQRHHYEQMLQQLYVEGLSLFLTLITGTISICFSPNIACVATLCACFQFLLSLTKTRYYDLIEKQFAEKFQDKIRELSSSPASSPSPCFARLNTL